MPMPKLLKKLSRKSFRGNDSETETDSPPAVPHTEYDTPSGDDHRSYSTSTPLFTSAASSPAQSGDWSHHITRSKSAGESSAALYSVHSRNPSQYSIPQQVVSYAPPSGSPPLPRSRTTSYSSMPAEMDSRQRLPSRTQSQLGFHLPMTPNSPLSNPAAGPLAVSSAQGPTSVDLSPGLGLSRIPTDDLSRSLAGAWESANTAPKTSRADQLLLVAENRFTQAQVQEGKAAAIATGVVAGLTAVGGMEAIEHGLHSIAEGMPVLMNALDEVAKLHPSVAVMAFKAVWALELKRRANDKMILSLHLEMKDMMGVLTQLKDVKDAEEVAPDGSTIRGRMQGAVNGTAEDIKSCANTCDTYTKKKLIVKVLKGPIWEGKLVKYVGIFTKRRGEFEFALSIHTALGVDAANRALNVVDKTTQEMNAKMDLMMKMFQTFISPEQRDMARLVEQKGGLQACEGNDKILRELSEAENKSGNVQAQLGPNTKSAAKATSGSKTFGLDDLKDELRTDPDAAAEQNLISFTRKFEVQQRQIIDELSKVVAREGDRVISALTGGPHEKIVDPDVHKVWKDMGWRGSIKSRYFVMALRDHYQEHGESETMTKPSEDEWALHYIAVSRLQPISEAFDDDASGFVTVSEANTFTADRPLDWRHVKKWLSFWAIGWHQSMTQYAGKIRELLAKMFSLRFHVLQANQVSVDKYLDTIYEGVTTLHSALNPCYVNLSLQERFKSYVEAEEARLRGNLEAVSFDIDATNTLSLVTGPGRIERFLFPLLYLILERQFQVLRACQTKILHPDELWDAADTVEWVLMAARDRVTLLESMFKQQKVDMKQQFKTFAHGLFQYMHDPSGLWAPKLVLAQEEAEYAYDDLLEDQEIDYSKILNHPLGSDTLDFDAYKPPVKAKKAATRPAPALKQLLGIWNGFTYEERDDTVPCSGMLSFNLVATGNLTFEAVAQRANATEFSISGQCSAQHLDIVNFTFKRTYTTRFSPVHYAGTWDSSSQALTGSWGGESDPRTHTGVFIFKRMAPECMTFFPPPVTLKENSSKALWHFAIDAVRYGVRRGTWSWTFFEQRFETRKRFLELYVRGTFGTPLNDHEEEELGLIKKSLTAADSRFYHSIADTVISQTTDHDVIDECDLCILKSNLEGHVGGSRITCLSCRLESEATLDTVDFCDNPSCSATKVIPSGLTKPHLPTHDILKVRRVVHIREFGKTYRQAKAALKKSRDFFPQPADENTKAAKKTGPSRPAPRCAVCRRPATQPCWFCVQCEDPSFICMACDRKKKYSFPGHRMDAHDLVRCSVSVETVEVALEERLVDLEARIQKHQANIDDKLVSMEVKMGERLSRLDSRMDDLESLIRELINTVGPRTTSTAPATVLLPSYPKSAPSYLESYP
ncbi:hypothetical protein R3P38DRAFT_2495366 [Favolaschia claudopus]|uniref:Vacuolar protein sorting-associated protein 13 second N-terminal domain-containing protein n=1 Tax=Favolaschia claudopus TaxID=2862362 RepID=A0AAW0EDC6_9AGAR